MNKLVAMIALMLPLAAGAQGYNISGKNIIDDVTTITPQGVGDNDYVVVYSVSDTNTGAGTAEKIHLNSLGAAAETLTAATTLTSTDCGKTLFLAASTEFNTELPGAIAGCSFSIIVASPPSGASYTISAPAAASMVGSVNVASSVGALVASSSGTLSATFIASAAINGDRIDLESDGTLWYVTGNVGGPSGFDL